MIAASSAKHQGEGGLAAGSGPYLSHEPGANNVSRGPQGCGSQPSRQACNEVHANAIWHAQGLLQEGLSRVVGNELRGTDDAVAYEVCCEAPAMHASCDASMHVESPPDLKHTRECASEGPSVNYNA